MYTLGYSGYTRDARSGPGIRNPFAKTDQDFNTICEFRDGEVPFSFFPLGYFGHDASAALLQDGKIIACAAEERFTRVKYSLNLAGNTLLPRNAIQYCLSSAGISIADIDTVAHYCHFTQGTIDKRVDLLRPFLSANECAQVSRSYDQIFNSMMDVDILREQFNAMTGVHPADFVQVRHHLAHAASAFYPSGFSHALIYTIDGTGELESSLLATGCNGIIDEVGSVALPTSIGTLYLIMTVFLGFKSLGDEYKVMGLASYGDPSVYRKVFDRLVTLHADGAYATPGLMKIDLKEFLLAAFGAPRARNGSIESRHANIAAGLQEALNNSVLHTLLHAQKETGLTDLCMAGGVALNCTMNGVIARSGLFKRIYVQPAANDEGCSAGAALYAFARRCEGKAAMDLNWKHVYWGPSYSDHEILTALQDHQESIRWTKDDCIAKTVAREISEGKVAGWFQNRMEFGPRALGNRSILADPRDAGMKDTINEKVKRRESFRPFAPAVIEECAAEFFDMTGLQNSPFMLFTVPVKEDKRAMIPAVTHVDGTARVQTVSRNTNPLFWELLQEVNHFTGVPVVLNTSFNVRNEPIVCSPNDAIECFLSTNIDCVGIGNYFVTKKFPND